MHGLLLTPPRALLALVLAGSIVLAGGPPAGADPRSEEVEQRAGRVEAVFTATVVTEDVVVLGTGPRERRVRRYTAAVEQVFQGTVTGSPVAISLVQRTGCTLPRVTTEAPWVFFVDGRGTQFRGTTCGGTRPVTAGYLRVVEGALGPGEAVAEPTAEPPPLDWTKVSTTDPPALGRLVAPGAALAIVGLLGLAVVRRRSGRG